MRYFLPRLKIATLCEQQEQLRSKIGGVPWGFPVDRWPECCGRPQKLLAQLCHEPPMLDLGATDSVLHLFQCLECCGIDDSNTESCGRAALLINRSDLGSGFLTVKGYDEPADLGNALIGEVWIEGWDPHDDGIPEERFPEFFNEPDVWTLQDEYPEIDWFGEMTKFGGSPRWTVIGPAGLPPQPFEFLFQINTYLYVDGQPPIPNEVGCTVSTYTNSKGRKPVWLETKPDPHKVRINAPWGIQHEESDDHCRVEFTNLGSDGTLYVFIDRTCQPHAVKWFWNR